MSFIGDIIGNTLGGITGAKQSAKAQQQASQTLASSADKALAEQRAARDQSVAMQQPYVDAGTQALTEQMKLIGLKGTTGQQDAVNALIGSPQYSSTVRQGEEGILQNAAATGGLRGGNTQNSLANFRADLLSDLIQRQVGNLTTLSGLGQNAATGAGNTIGNTANNVSTLLGEQASALAGGQVAKGNVVTNTFNNGAKIAGTVIGAAKAF